MADRGARRHRQGDAGLSLRAHGAGRGRWARGHRSRAPGVSQGRGAVASEPSRHPPRLEREVEALCANDRRRRGQALARLSRHDGGRGKLAGRHCRPRRRAEPERGECAVEGAGRAATPDFVPADLERRGTASRHHPFAQPDAARLGLGGGGSDGGGARRSRSRRAGGGRQGARHRTCSERWKRASRARARLKRGHRALRRNRRRTRRACPRSTVRGCIAMSSGSPAWPIPSGSTFIWRCCLG